ncbi:sulfotransferase domain-containing protein [Synechococcus sp. HIMB2401]|uniref:sulfotransferase domain-containing protein n=1 Tax=Synechococcus sp. HIMB2401 TaxID=3144208 RepID=UPI0036F22802
MNADLAININVQVKTSAEITEQLMVCSHERSGTHLTMNTIDAVSEYCSNPWLNYDLRPLGSMINFFNPTSTSTYIRSLSDIKVNGTSRCNASIIKSHFPISHLGEEVKNLPLKIIYVWRDPAETIASLWKYLHRWSWDEGPKTETPIELATARPSGQSQRYQTSNYKDYFERWAAHVIDGIAQCKNNPMAKSVSYRQLLTNHTAATESLCNSLDIQMLKKPLIPSNDEIAIKGSDLNLDADIMARLRDLCNKRIEEFPALKALLSEDQNPFIYS